jgi:dTDP-4-amino-4,6-dideoxygalactose transaminase
LDQKFLPIAKPDLGEQEIAEVLDTLNSGWLAYGPKTQRLEAEFAKLAETKHAVAVSSCTAGMHLALLAAGIGAGDEVITSTLTFASTANVIVHAGATPVVADIRADDLTIDPEDIVRRITPRTKAIMPVDYAGHPPRLDEIRAIAREHGLLVIEDAATAAGSYYKGRPIGCLSDATVFSFYAIKNMTTGQGGMVTTGDDRIAERVRVLRANGLDSNAWNRYSAEGTPFYTVIEPGFNYGMTDLQASIGIGQLARLGEFNKRRGELAARYDAGFAAVPEVETPVVSPDVTTNWHLYVIRLRDTSVSRDALIAELKQRGIGTAVHYYPVHYHPFYRETYGFKTGDYPVAEAEFARMVSLPLYPMMEEADVDRVVAAVEEIVAAGR